MLDPSIRFDFIGPVLEMALGNVQVTPKKAWSKMVWEQAWKLDDTYWKSNAFMQGRNDLLFKTVGKSQYLTWWYLAENSPQLQSMCEDMARLVC